MKENLTLLLLGLLLCNSSFAESYYFKKCKLSNTVTGNYIINFDKKLIQVNLRSVDGAVQNFSDKIKLVDKYQVVSEKIKSKLVENIYYQYFLESKSQSVIKMQYKKESGLDMDIFKLNQKRKSYCSDVKADWDKEMIEKTETNKEQKRISKAQEKIKKEQSSLIKCQGNDHKQWTNCKGSYEAETGHKYDGTFKDGEIVKGISIYPGGAKYVGEFKNYRPHGYGNFAWANGDKYFGECKNGKSNGNGTKIWNDGRE